MKPLEVKKVEAPEAALEVLKMEPPPPRPEGRVLADVRDKDSEEIRAAVQELVKLLREEAKVL